MKVAASVSLDMDNLRLARDMGLNISQICDEAIKQVVIAKTKKIEGDLDAQKIKIQEEIVKLQVQLGTVETQRKAKEKEFDDKYGKVIG